MSFDTTSPVALVFKGDPLCAELLGRTVRQALPRWELRIASTLEAAMAQLGNASFLLTGLDPALEGDVLSWVFELLQRPNAPRVLVAIGREDTRLLTALETLTVPGAFDTATESMRFLESTIQTVAAHGRYWSATLAERARCYRMAPDSPGKLLTGREQVALAIFGDGRGDEEAADVLGLAVSSVCSVRKSLHRKLGVRHRGELMRVAAQHAYVRFTSHGIVRPGIALLQSAARRRRGISRVDGDDHSAAQGLFPRIQPSAKFRAGDMLGENDFAASIGARERVQTSLRDRFG